MNEEDWDEYHNTQLLEMISEGCAGDIHLEIRGNKTACEISLVELNPVTKHIRRNKILCGGEKRVTCEVCKSYIYGNIKEE